MRKQIGRSVKVTIMMEGKVDNMEQKKKEENNFSS
jgi:hypothetical protein